MSKPVQRVSQLISTFGPGAMIDLPTRSVLVRGLEGWDVRGDAFKLIDEPRLTEFLEKALKEKGRLAENDKLRLLAPPVLTSFEARDNPGVEVTIFPTWFVCDQAEIIEQGNTDRRRRQLIRWNDLRPEGGRRQFVNDDGKKVDVSPIRFVAACQKGHLQDIDWKWVVHGGDKCDEAMWVEERGTSADPADTSIVCGCGKRLSLEQAFQPGRLGRCQGRRPWLQEDEPTKTCPEGHMLRLLTRSATNTYFPQVATVISLPIGEDEITKLVASVADSLTEVKSIADVAMARKFNPKVKITLEGISDADVFARIEGARSQVAREASGSPKQAEFDILASGHNIIGENNSNARLFAQTLHRDVWERDIGLDLSSIKNLVAVHRLREVVCLYGFTRFEGAPSIMDDDLEDIRLAVDGAPLSVDRDWLPAMEQFGEGLFIHFDETKIAEWLTSPNVLSRAWKLIEGHDKWKAKSSSRRVEFPGLPYVMLHSLSHALMAEIAMDCGYPASSLKERIYALRDSETTDRFGRCGILIYTATAGTLGTLGGLVGLAPRFATVLRAALERLRICSNDPICTDHDPHERDDDRALHGAACHSCLLIAETSCEKRNLYLDRSLLVETLTGLGAGFFQFF